MSLGQYIVRALKSMCRRLFARECEPSVAVVVVRSDAVQFLVQAWSEFEVTVMRKGECIEENDFGLATDADNEDEGEWGPE
jgi:hypothetical protein